MADQPSEDTERDLAPITTTGYVILGMLTERDWTAYELAEQVGKGLTEVWPRASRQLYNAPKRLVDDGLVAAHEESTGRRTRTRYSITSEGRRALREWLSTVSAPPSLEFEGMVRVLVANDGDLDDLQSNLITMEEQARANRALFVAHAHYMLEHGGTYANRRPLMALANRFMIDHYTNILSWAAWARGEIEDWEDTVNPTPTVVEDADEVLRGAIAKGTHEPVRND